MKKNANKKVSKKGHPVILGKKLLSDAEILFFGTSPQNVRHLNILELQKLANEAALVSSMALLRISKSDEFPESLRRSAD